MLYFESLFANMSSSKHMPVNNISSRSAISITWET